MKYYKNLNNEIFAYEADGSQDHIIPEDFIAITDAEVNQLRAANSQAAFNALDYAEKRRATYPPLTDYIDAMVKGDQEAIDKYIADCKAVKAKYSKP